MKESIDFERTPIPALFKKIFFPTLLGMLGISAVTTIDGIFVGHGVGSDGIAAINLCIPLLMVLTGIGLMVGMGSSVISSVYLSRGKVRQARTSITQALLFVTVITVVLVTFIMCFPSQVARLLGASDHLLPQVVDYLLWFSPSLVCELWIAVAMFALRLDGVPKLSMWCSLVSAAVNVVLDYLFIFPLNMGVAGAALATSISCVVGAAMALGYLGFFARSLRLRSLRIDRRGAAHFLRAIGRQCKIGSSALLGEATMAVLMFVGNHVFMRHMGDAGVAAFGVSCYYLPFVFMIGNAIAQSAQPIISYNFGAGLGGRIRQALRVSVETSVVCGIISTAAFIFCPKLLVGLFLPLDDVAAIIAVEGFPYMGTAFIFFIVNLCCIGYFQSVERVRPATLFALLRGAVFLLPSFLLLPQALGTSGIWLALAASEVLTTLCIAGFYLRRRAA